MNTNPSFLDIQTASAWGRTLAGFADWCLPLAHNGEPPPVKALDIGSGPGLLPALMAQRGCDAFGADLDATALTRPLHPALTLADALRLPFAPESFDLLTATNVLFLLPDPGAALREMARLLRPHATLALLNPSEHMSVVAAMAVADSHRLTGLDRQSLLGWAQRAEANHRWTEAEMRQLLADAGLGITVCVLKIGPGLARWVKAVLL